ncbi:hypothetical protein CYMTET_51664 [Cymbomonas tetramitiformis]|uniref:Uncharacterized protein n=1 Tax=Cymbomonas tetramitiformis TaxID=36881 RepID=A0AAE0ETG3_9CHLO|nr:hypothetical protein CYMTET_51664 [Cymbomonas tetramitiformis]
MGVRKGAKGADGKPVKGVSRETYACKTDRRKNAAFDDFVRACNRKCPKALFQVDNSSVKTWREPAYYHNHPAGEESYFSQTVTSFKKETKNNAMLEVTEKVLKKMFRGHITGERNRLLGSSAPDKVNLVEGALVVSAPAPDRVKKIEPKAKVPLEMSTSGADDDDDPQDDGEEVAGMLALLPAAHTCPTKEAAPPPKRQKQQVTGPPSAKRPPASEVPASPKGAGV